MQQEKRIPEAVLKDISLYMVPGERVVNALASTSGPVGKLGELWMVSTDLTIYFHTREHDKDPVVALIPRKDVKVVKYDHHASGTTLTFVPVQHPKNTIRVPFTKAQRTQVNAFCEELAKTVPFELVEDKAPATETGSSSKPPEGKQSPAAPSFQETGKAGSPPAKALPQPPAQPATLPKELFQLPIRQHQEPPVREAEKPAGEKPPSATETPSKNSGEKPRPIPPATPTKIGQSDVIEATVPSPESEVRFVLLATGISVLVGFLWYFLFRSLLRKSS